MRTKLDGKRAKESKAILLALFCFVGVFGVFALAHDLTSKPYFFVAGDWRVFFGAVHLMEQGGNPYNSGAIHGAEQAALFYPPTQPAPYDFVDLPIVGWILWPFMRLPFWVSFSVFSGMGVGVAGFSLRVWMREAGWKKPGAWLLAGMASWVMLFGFVLGQFDAVLLGGMVAGLILMRKNLPWLAGLCTVVVLLKPHILWPLPILLAAVWTGRDGRAIKFAISAGVVMVGGALLGFLVTPGSGSFFTHALGFGTRIGSEQPDLAGIPGLLLRLPGGWMLGGGVALLGGLAVLGLAGFCRFGKRVGNLTDWERGLVVLVGFAVWLACAPYAHPNDEILLFPLVIGLIGERGSKLGYEGLSKGVILALLVGVTLVTSTLLGLVGLGLVLVVGMGIEVGIWKRKQLSSQWLISAGVVALALLPTWPFYTPAVSATPVAVALVAGAGVFWLGEKFTGTERQGALGALMEVGLLRFQ
jgi:hypothetical protein